ncbi:MAG: tRNA (adenosine(37)-N6)-threonylcarbamoyltransferase complex dimerization subunit type 1 TsaB [Chloroflexi bacterium]|nr:tRNA (adenosine(37)-N6)-threonylcarbamoyltransferase complex dimerization subunit type 1 TsaB [Chloroflexota bacterium]
MKILGIDTSTGFAGVGLNVDGETSTAIWWSRHNHGREVMPAVMRLLDAAGIEVHDLDAVAVALGPGGFSAVRVGIATGQGLTTPTDGRLIGIPTHLIQAFPLRDEIDKRIVSLIPVGRRQVSYGAFTGPVTAVDGPVDVGICEIAEIGERFDNDATILCGEGAVETAPEEADSRPVRDPHALLAIALARIDRGLGVDDAPKPIYSRPPTITAPKRV